MERNFSDEAGSNNVGDSLSQAGQELGDEMDDVRFLQECGIKIDHEWLLECACQDGPAEVRNHAESLIRIAGMLSGHSSSMQLQLNLLQ